MNTTRCSTCEAEIFWTITERGARMPMDAKPERKFLVREATESAPSAVSTLVYTSHFVTCPDRDQHRSAR